MSFLLRLGAFGEKFETVLVYILVLLFKQWFGESKNGDFCLDKKHFHATKVHEIRLLLISAYKNTISVVMLV